LRLGVPLITALVVGPFWLRPDRNAAPTPAFEPIDLGGLPEIRARDGLLSATFIAAPLRVTIGGASFMGAAFNGAYAGPVLRAHPGDLVHLHLLNHMPDIINLHFHGMRITPDGRGDNMHIAVKPGASFDYLFRIPASHPPGLFWYHDHAPEAAEPHVMAGLSGAFLVEGFRDQFKTLNTTEQKLLVLKDWTSPRCADPVLKTAFHCHALSINGQAQWTTSLAPGQRQLWRLSSQSANLIIHLSAPGLHVRIIGRDGVAATSGTASPTIDILPASRIDALVWADNPGAITLAATHVPTGTGKNFTTTRPLGSITVQGAPARQPAAEPIYPQAPDLRHRPVDARRTIIFAENAAATRFTVNGKIFDAKRIDLRVPLGTTEEWTIRNDTNDFHEFHIHQLGFQVTAINGAPQPFTGYVDDVTVPEQGSVTVLIPFTDPLMVGHFMFHCHVLKHEDRGMMANIEVYWPGLLHICAVPPS